MMRKANLTMTSSALKIRNLPVVSATRHSNRDSQIPADLTLWRNYLIDIRVFRLTKQSALWLPGSATTVELLRSTSTPHSLKRFAFVFVIVGRDRLLFLAENGQ